ncbi:DUF2059 domain-containing protein [Pedobacter frigoris]|uniref:DUF2059 domain-containing protein n=1 Tax=Pedobacter frigoris TaxID=2571272 RepID=A0A4U1CRY0_9SPHI|nr:DUF2059 domain-containing protein [Pedobacter frigoris]TKC09680.1 DUF2059 domain-containing protein [Pedobacter frigoris]
MKKLMFSAMIVVATSFAASAQDSTSYGTTLNKLLEVSGSTKTFIGVIPQMISMLKTQVSNSAIPEEFWTEMQTEISKFGGKDLGALLVPVYQKYMTETDLKSIIAFYESPAGRKFAEKTPLITQESMAIGQEWGKKIGEKVISKLMEKGYMKE